MARYRRGYRLGYKERYLSIQGTLLSSLPAFHSFQLQVPCPLLQASSSLCESLVSRTFTTSPRCLPAPILSSSFPACATEVHNKIPKWFLNALHVEKRYTRLFFGVQLKVIIYKSATDPPIQPVHIPPLEHCYLLSPVLPSTQPVTHPSTHASTHPWNCKHSEGLSWQGIFLTDKDKKINPTLSFPLESSSLVEKVTSL